MKWTWLLISKFHYCNLSLSNVHSPMKPPKPTRSKPIWRVTNVIYHDGCCLKILKRILTKFIWMKANEKIVETCSLGTIFWETTKTISKSFLKIKSNFYPLKVHNYHLVKVSKKKIYYFIIQGIFNHYKHCGMEFSLNSSIY
jgi:hypothetical protein